MKTWKMMKCFVSTVKIVAIDRVCSKSKVKDWDYMSAINFWDNVQNDFIIKYMDNNKQKKPSQKTVYHLISSSNIFQNPKNAL